MGYKKTSRQHPRQLQCWKYVKTPRGSTAQSSKQVHWYDNKEGTHFVLGTDPKADKKTQHHDFQGKSPDAKEKRQAVKQAIHADKKQITYSPN